MYLDSRHSGFILLFPPTFYGEDIKKRYKSYVKQMLLPYENVDDFMSSTVQQVSFPGFDMVTAQQTRMYGKQQDYKSAKPVEDLIERSLTVTFQITDGFVNYFIFFDNAIKYLYLGNSTQYFDIMRLGWLSREGWMLGHVDFIQVTLTGMSGFKLSYSAMGHEFNTFDAKFKFNDWRVSVMNESFNPVPAAQDGLANRR